MAQWLRALAILPEDLGSIPSTDMMARNSSSRGSETTFTQTYTSHHKTSMHIRTSVDWGDGSMGKNA